MRQQRDSNKYLDAVIVLCICTAFIFLSPFLFVWSLPGAPWYLPYLLWLSVIVLAALVQILWHRHEL